MNDYKRLTCPCALPLYLELQKPSDGTGAATREDGLYQDLLGMSAQLHLRYKVYQETDFPVELIVVPCSQHSERSIEYLTVPLNLTTAIAELSVKLSTLSEDRTKRSMYCAVLARLRHLRFVCTDERGDLVAAGTYLRSCVDQSTLDAFHESLLQAEMGIYIHARYHLLGEPALIRSAIEKLELAVGLSQASSSPSALPLLLRELGSLYFCQFRSSQDLDHLDKAISHLRESVSVTTQDQRTLISCSRLCIDTILARFAQTQHIGDLDDAIRHHEGIGNLIGCQRKPPEGKIEPEAPLTAIRCEWLRVYSTLLYTRFMSSHITHDLQLAVQTVEPLVEQLPSNWSSNQRGAIISCLVNCLVERFRTDGRVEDLNRVAELVSYNPDTLLELNPDALEHVYQMGKLLVTAFEWFRRKKDIDAAVGKLSVSVFQANTMKWASRDVQTSYKVHLDMADIAYVKRAILINPHPKALVRVLEVPKEDRRLHLRSARQLHDWFEYTLRLHDLGRAQAMRFEYDTFRNDVDIAHAIEVLGEAVQVAPSSSGMHWQYVLSLGDAYRVRFTFMRRQHDLDQAVLFHRQALSNFPAPDVCRVRALCCLGRSLFLQAMAANDLPSYRESIECFKEAAEAQYGFAHDRLNSAIVWASLLHSSASLHVVDEQERLKEALEGYKHAIQLLVRAAWIGLSATSRLARLYSIPRTLASDAATCAIRLAEVDSQRREEYLGVAVQLLDQGRAILWSQASQLRADLRALALQEPELAKQLDIVAKQVAKTAFRNVFQHKEQAGRTTEQLALQWEALLEEVRKLDNFHDFLQPVSFAKLKEAAASATIVIVNVSEHRCDAVIIPPEGSLRLVPLKNLSRSQIDYAVADLHGALPGDDSRRELKAILAKLWEDICQPILPELQNLSVVSSDPHDGPPAHIRWCLTGRLAMFPLHAAGPRRQSRKNPGMLDWVISSYIPTLSMLLESHTRRATPREPRLLAVCHSGGSQRGRLPMAKKEVDILRACAGTENVSVIMDNAARVNTVCDALRGSDWVHFACHGTQSITNPMDSALVLDDGNLPVSRLAEQEGGEFAMLLACETALGVPGLSDEAIHVAAGLHFAGFRSVIATMWTMCDEHGPIVAEKVYEHLFREKHGGALPDASESAYALRKALLFLRDEKKLHVHDWAPFMHFGV